ncbi:MAG: tetratricopeptide repeat protein [Paludibacter sp.]|nr:tetratricopeptide repeat protein [Paludibacter sp.]
MKNRLFYSITILSLIFIVGGCSTKKNTWATRAYQDVNTRFNVFFNGTTSYNEGLRNILKANEEDYSSIIPMFPISRHKNANAATTEMDRTIEKCRKAIKLHSIKIKPERNLKKSNLPEYKLFYNQEEFNPALKDVWLQLGKAEFHKGDFLGSVGTFSYIARHYSEDKDMIAKCQLWMVRAYAEMGWIYEAEQVLSKIVQDDLKRSNIGLFASVNADLLLKKRQYKDAIPFLELALSKENDKAMKQRFTYLSAQLYHKMNDDKAAYNAYSKVIKMNPTFEMDFNARINRTQLDNRNVTNVRKELKQMLKNQNNKEYLDQIYFALGNSYLQNSDTLKAIDNYKLSTEKSTRNGIDKAMTLITLGDLYYIKKNYVKAQPCYDEASKILSNEHDDYARVTRLAEMLGELVAQNDIVLLQDSLQLLAALPESKRIEVVNKIIDKIFADEKLAEEKALKEKEIKNNPGDEDFANMPPVGMNPGGMGGWYFYNPDLMRSGQAEFVKKWGRRKLEDNWRRTNKTASLFTDEISTPMNTPAVNDSTAATQQIEVVPDNKKPEFYLRQIPVTPSQIKKSNAEIATALFSMGQIYKDKIEDFPMAISTFNEFIRRFGDNELVPDAYFNLYMIQTKLNNESDANLYRTKLINEFPNSKYYKILSQPDYIERFEKMLSEQDSIYNLTYIAYNKSDFLTVFNHVEYIQKNYPLSTLMPKFLFLNALSIGKKESPEKFRAALDSLVTLYPESDVSAMSKDILALIKQGQEAKTGTSSGTLLTRREETVKTEINEISPQQFSTEKLSKHRLMLISSAPADKLNKLLYNLASFNFTRFMIKDFDLVINKLDSIRSAVSVTNFESYDEAQWYLNSIGSDEMLKKLTTDLVNREVIISEDNYALLRTVFSMDEYLAFQEKQNSVKPSQQVATNKPIKKQEVVPIVKENKPKNVPTTAVEVKPEKAIDKTSTKQVEKPAEVLAEKPVQKVAAESAKKTSENTNQEVQKTQPVPAVVPVQPKVDDVPLFKNLFAYRANEPHFVAIYIVSGTFDYEKTKAAIDAYNALNYAVMNLKVTLETFEKQQIIIIGSLTDAQIGKSYLLRMVKEKALFEGLKGSVYRNLLGSQKNLNTVMQKNALSTYFEFMQEYYLK